jgi:hypothetical protein
MQRTTIGVDLAKNCFQVAIADPQYRIEQLTRTRFSELMSQHPASLVVMGLAAAPRIGLECCELWP